MTKPPFKKGDRVIVKATELHEQLRGRHGVVIRVMHKQYKMHVRLDGSPHNHYIHPENLVKETTF